MNYYNENDPKTAAWLRELIRFGHVSKGIVDDRSILEVRPADLKGFQQIHLFAGIGGWSIALRLAGVSDDSPAWTISCPCQPFSCAGNRKGKDDPRHLWPHARRLIRQRSPEFIVGEQTASADGRIWLDGVQADLEALGYANGGSDLCATGVGAPHRRQRLYWMAIAFSRRRRERCDATSREEGWHSLFEQRGINGWLADTYREGHQGFNRAAKSGEAEKDGAREKHTGGSIWLGNPDSPRSQGRDGAELPECSGEQTVGERGSSGGVGDSTSDDQQRHRESGESNGRYGPSGGSGAWSDFQLIPCRDGKTRRVESGTFPLANGVPARVVRLRGYGNAIVPPLAAEFIQASLEAIGVK